MPCSGLPVQAVFSWYRGMCEYVFPAVTAGSSLGSHREVALVGAIGINARILESGNEYSAACKLMGALSELCGRMTEAQWVVPLDYAARAYKKNGAINQLRQGFGIEADVVDMRRKEVLGVLGEAYFLPWVMPVSEEGFNLSHDELLALWKERAPACLVSLASYILCLAMSGVEGSDSSLSCSYLRRVVNEYVRQDRLAVTRLSEGGSSLLLEEYARHPIDPSLVSGLSSGEEG